MTPKKQNTTNLSHKKCRIVAYWANGKHAGKTTSLGALYIYIYISVEKETILYFYVFTDKLTEHWTGEMHHVPERKEKASSREDGQAGRWEKGGRRPQMRIKLPCWGILFVSFTWLEAELLDSGFGSSDGCPSIFKMSLSDTGFALAARWSVRAQVSLGGRFGTSRAAVGLLNGGHLHIWPRIVGEKIPGIQYINLHPPQSPRVIMYAIEGLLLHHPWTENHRWGSSHFTLLCCWE